MHCKACTILIQDILETIDGIDDVQVHLRDGRIDFSCHDNHPENDNQLIERLNPFLTPYKYSLSTNPIKEPYNWRDLILATIISSALLYAFITIQKLGLIDFISSDGAHRTYGTSFVLGLIASVSSCLAVAGWLGLGLWAIYKDSSSFLPHTLFHFGRLSWFFVLWGILGTLGWGLQLSPSISTGLNMIIAVVIFILWLNLLGFIRGGVTFGEWIWRIFSSSKFGNLAPLILGIGTFFLPCGFTQSMQLYTLTTGSFVEGWLAMFAFALGTFPVLLLLSVSGKAIQKNEELSSLFFKTIWIILVMFAIFNIVTSMVALGFIDPIL